MIACSCCRYGLPLVGALLQVGTLKYKRSSKNLLYLNWGEIHAKLFCYSVGSDIIHRRSNMIVHVLLNLLNQLRKLDKMQGFVEHFIAFFQRV